VNLDLAGAGMDLEPETTYHYRVIAATAVQTVDTINWEDPIVDGTDRTFTTPPAVAGAPVIVSKSASHITEHDATLEAQINPGGLETTYEFHVTSPACQREWPVIGPCMAISVWSLPGGSIPAGFDDRTVSLDLASAGVTLQPGTWYEYAVTASNAAGQAPPGGWGATQQSFKTSYRVIASNGISVEGPDQTFTTPSSSLGDQQSQGDGQRAGRCPDNVAAPPGCAVKDSYKPSQTSKPQRLTRAREFAIALKACSKKPKRNQAACENQARRRYGPRRLKVRQR
jgi:hypothetical protein